MECEREGSCHDRFSSWVRRLPACAPREVRAAVANLLRIAAEDLTDARLLGRDGRARNAAVLLALATDALLDAVRVSEDGWPFSGHDRRPPAVPAINPFRERLAAVGKAVEELGGAAVRADGRRSPEPGSSRLEKAAGQVEALGRRSGKPLPGRACRRRPSWAGPAHTPGARVRTGRQAGQAAERRIVASARNERVRRAKGCPPEGAAHADAGRTEARADDPAEGGRAKEQDTRSDRDRPSGRASFKVAWASCTDRTPTDRRPRRSTVTEGRPEYQATARRSVAAPGAACARRDVHGILVVDGSLEDR